MADEDKKPDDQIEIEAKVEDKAPEKEPDDEGIPPEEGIEDLRRSLEEQKKAAEEARVMRIAAEKRAYEAQVREQEALKKEKSAQYDQVGTAIALYEDREKAIQSALIDAKTVGDYAREAELHKQWQETLQALDRLKRGHATLDSQLKQPVAPVPPPQIDPIEAFASQMSPRSASWLLSNRSFLDDGRGGVVESSRLRLAAAHNLALAEGYQVDTNEYFAFIEEQAGMRSRPRRHEDDGQDDGPLSGASAPRRSAPPPAAPVTRGGERRGSFRLSESEREIARLTGQTDEQYYKNKMRK